MRARKPSPAAIIALAAVRCANATNWSDFQVKMHMHKLEELEYVLVHRGGRGQSFVYELLYDGAGRDGKPFLMGLIDVQMLKHAYDGKKEHRNPNLEHPSSPQVASHGAWG